MSRPLVDIRLEALSTRGGKPPGLDSISVHVRYGEFFTFLGPPHSGKTDVLQAVAGFMPPSHGRILVDGQDIGDLPPGQRSVGYVFQEGALWPHMTAVQHVAFGLEPLHDAARFFCAACEHLADRTTCHFARVKTQ